MKLHFHPASPNARRPRLVARLTKIVLEEVLVDLATGANRTPEYLALNPNGKVPTLEDGGFVIWESNAISRYLCAKAGDTTLYPADARGQADVSRWQDWQLSSWGPPIGKLLWENMFKQFRKLGEPDPVAVASAEKDFHVVAGILDAHLAKREWLSLGRLTLGDIALATPLMWKDGAKLPLENYKHINGWFARIAALDAWTATDMPRST